MLSRIAFLPLIVAFAGCHSPTEISGVSHDPGRFLNSTEATQWIELDDASYAKLQPDDFAIYAIDHPMTVRLQAWGDLIRKNMLKSSPTLSQVPRPIFRVVDTKDVNAYVAAAPVCVKVRMRSSDTPKSARLSDEYLDLLGAGTDTCLPFSGNLAAMRTVSERSLRILIPSCKVVVGDDELVVDSTCINALGRPQQVYSGIIVPITHNYVTFFRGILEGLPEQEAISVLAHELGHYYMAHASTSQEDYNYFYERGVTNSKGKPQPLPSSHPLVDLGNRIQQLPPANHGAKVAGQTLHSLFYFLTGNLQNYIQDGDFPRAAACLPSAPDCLAKCSEFGARRRTDYNGALVGFPHIFKGDEASKAAYALYEEDLRSCFSGVRASGIVGAREVVKGLLEYALQSKVKVVVNEVAPGQSLLRMLEDTNTTFMAQLATIPAQREALLSQGMVSGLGWYTTEQEADDIATEMVIRLGFDNQTYLRTSLYLVDLAAKPEASAECRRQYAAGFPTPVPEGDYSEVHHDSCFRAYNSYKELEVHREDFKVYKEERTQTVQSELSWNDAVSLLRTIPGRPL